MSAVAERPRVPRAGAAGDALVLRAYQRCEWYELALMRHGFTVERLQKLSRKIANDGLRLRGATLGDRFNDLVSRLQIVGLQAALRYDPQRHHESYGKNGGEPFASYVADLMGKRIDDYFRSKAEGHGDRRYGLDNRIDLTDDPDPADHDVDFSKIVGDRERSEWQLAAQATGWELDEWMKITLNKAAKHVLRAA